jgi:hypothetical protein
MMGVSSGSTGSGHNSPEPLLKKRQGILARYNEKGDGAHGRIRTSDRLVRSQVLYPTELHARITANR